MADLILALATYGSHRVTDPQTKEVVSAYKMGYSSAASAILLALYGAKAHNVSSPHASYHYIKIDAEVSVWHGHLLLKVTGDELARAEGIARQSYRAGAFLWREGQWFELPNSRIGEYIPVKPRSGPDFNPTGYRIVSASTGEKEAAVKDTITAEKSQREAGGKVWWWLLGDTYPHRELLKRHGACFSSKRRAWYYIGAELPAAIRALVTPQTEPDDASPSPLRIVDTEHASSAETAPSTDAPASAAPATPVMRPELAVMIEEALAADDSMTHAPTPEAAEVIEVEAPKIRVIKPPGQLTDDSKSDAVQTAIREAKAAAPATITRATAMHTGKRVQVDIPQAYVGEVTGSITGHVWCYGYAVHDGICVYLNVGGPRMAVEAIRAKLAKGDIVSVVPWDGPAVELTAGEGNTGMYHDYFANIPEARFTSLILLHDQVVNPNYGGKAMTFLLYVSEAQAIGQLHQHVSRLVKVPVFESWAGYLWTAGQAAMLIRKTRGAGGLPIYSLDLDIDAWTRLITGGLAQRVITMGRMNTD